MTDNRKISEGKRFFLGRIIPFKQRKFVFFFLLIYALYFSFSYGRFFYFHDETIIYENEKYNYSLHYPASWVVDEYSNGYKNLNEVTAIIRNGDYFSISKPTTKSIEIHYRQLESEKNAIDEVIGWGMELIEIKGINQPKINTLEDIKVGLLKHPASMQKFAQGYQTRWFIYLAIERNGYIIIFTTNSPKSFEDWNNFFDPILQSLNF